MNRTTVLAWFAIASSLAAVAVLIVLVSSRDAPRSGEASHIARAPAEASSRVELRPDASSAARSSAASRAGWQAIVKASLRAEFERRFARNPSEGMLGRLTRGLGRVRAASLALDANAVDSHAPNPWIQRRARLALLQADRLFRRELGVGVSDFLRGLDPGQVEEVDTPDSVEVDR
jgi:hypothetical protein